LPWQQRLPSNGVTKSEIYEIEKKTWVDIPDERQKSVIQDGVQDGCRTLIPNISLYGSVLE